MPDTTTAPAPRSRSYDDMPITREDCVSNPGHIRFLPRGIVSGGVFFYHRGIAIARHLRQKKALD